MAVANYESAHGHLPPAYQLGPDGRPWHSWRVLVLPYIEGDALFKRYRFDEPWDGPNNRRLAEQMPKTLAFHGTDRPTTTTNYLAVVGPETLWPGPVGLRRSVFGDWGETIHIAENTGLGVQWMEPRDLDSRTMNFDFNHPLGLSSWYKYPAAAMADGSIRSFHDGYDHESLRRMLTARGTFPVNDPAVRPLADGRLREKAGD